MLTALLAALGPEPLGNGFDEDYLVARLKGRNTPIKSALLDQHIVAGLGNIYVCEALWRSHLSPTRKVATLVTAKGKPKAELALLTQSIRDVIVDAIQAGGSSLRDYRQADGDLGYFQHSFRVYGREGVGCVTPGCTGVVQRLVQSGRSSFFCPICQH